MIENYFGKSYSASGQITSDYLIKTRGDVVVQTGTRFVKLISDGKVNVDIDFIKTIPTKDDISNEGIYYVEDEKSIYIKIGDELYLLHEGDDKDGYISYLVNQSLLNNQITTSQKNIGLVKLDLFSSDNHPEHAIVYDIKTDSVYTINNGIPSKLFFNVPEVINHRIFINGPSNEGSLIIMGIGYENRLSISDDSLQLYVEGDTSIINSNRDIVFSINDASIVSISNNNLTIERGNELIVNDIKSIDGNFKLVDSNGKSTLYVDNIITKSSEITYSELIDKINNKDLQPGKKYIIIDYQNEWEIILLEDSEILIEKNIYERDDDGNILYHDDDRKIPKILYYSNVHPITITATDIDKISNEVEYTKEGWSAYYNHTPRYIDDPNFDPDEGDDEDSKILDPSYKGIITKLTDEFNNTLNYDFKNLRYYYYNDDTEEFNLYFTFNGEYNNDASLLGEVNNVNITLDNYQIASQIIKLNPDYQTGNEYIKGDVEILRDGNILIFKDLVSYINIHKIAKTSIFDNKLNQINASTLDNVTFEDDIKYVNFHGVTEDKLFEKNKYPLLYQNDVLKDVYRNGDDYSVIFIPNLVLPRGIITMWYNKEIPKGWAICDGQNGTPNLIDKFIKSGMSIGIEGGSNEITITEENLPSHNHSAEVTSNEEFNKLNLSHNHKVNTGIKTSSSGEMVPIKFNSDIEEYQTLDEKLEAEISGDSIKVSIGNTGEGKPINIEPQYYTMIFIMKL